MITERRQHPRIVTDFPARVRNLAGEVMNTQLLDLSLCGLKLAADDALIAHIQVDDEDGKRVFPEEMQVEFTLPVKSEVLTIGLHCRLVHTRRLSQHAYQIGLRILQYDDASEEHLQFYINSQLK